MTAEGLCCLLESGTGLVFLHLVRRFWNQFLTCCCVSPSRDASWKQVLLLIYFCRLNFCSSFLTCMAEKVVLLTLLHWLVGATVLATGDGCPLPAAQGASREGGGEGGGAGAAYATLGCEGGQLLSCCLLQGMTSTTGSWASNCSGSEGGDLLASVPLPQRISRKGTGSLQTSGCDMVALSVVHKVAHDPHSGSLLCPAKHCSSPL